MKTLVSAGLAAGLVFGLAVGSAHAMPMSYSANLTPVNGVGSGSAWLTLDNAANTLKVDINASGLDEGTHLAHIHGLFSDVVTGMPTNSVVPDRSNDTDGDGFIEVAEGVPAYGPIILPMQVIGTGSVISFSETFDLTDPANFGFIGGDSTMPKYTIDDLLGVDGMSLDLREIVVHGQFAPAVGAGTPGEVDGTSGFKAPLPTLAGQIATVPEPSTWMMMLSGLFALGLRAQRRRKASVSQA